MTGKYSIFDFQNICLLINNFYNGNIIIAGNNYFFINDLQEGNKNFAITESYLNTENIIRFFNEQIITRENSNRIPSATVTCPTASFDLASDSSLLKIKSTRIKWKGISIKFK